MEFKITKEQIVAIEKVGGAEVSVYLRNNYPEAFKTELETGRWYKLPELGNILFCFKGKMGSEAGYGFDVYRNWSEVGIGFHVGDVFTPATEEEVSAALIAEAKKRGYKKGVTCVFGSAKDKRQLGTDCFFLENNTLCVKKKDSDNADIIFKDGIWAEILPTEKTVITKEKALKILAKKLKVSPENIEIE